MFVCKHTRKENEKTIYSLATIFLRSIMLSTSAFSHFFSLDVNVILALFCCCYLFNFIYFDRSLMYFIQHKYTYFTCWPSEFRNTALFFSSLFLVMEKRQTVLGPFPSSLCIWTPCSFLPRKPNTPIYTLHCIKTCFDCGRLFVFDLPPNFFLLLSTNGKPQNHHSWDKCDVNGKLIYLQLFICVKVKCLVDLGMAIVRRNRSD